MGMRLLPKSEVDKAKATEQKQAIDEGMKLAKRVDNLREIAASEEENLMNFRRVTVEKIHEEISTKAKRRDELNTEVAILEEKRSKALEPFTKELEAIQIKQEESLRREFFLNEREAVITRHELELENSSKESDGILARAKTKDELSNARLHDAQRAATEAESALAHARLVHEEALAYEAKIIEALTHRENIVLVRENDATIRGKELLAREIALADGWILLRDRQAMLEHEIKRARK